MLHKFLSSYTVRISKKAKRPQIVYSAKKGLEVVIPNSINLDVEQFISLNQKWIIKQIKKSPIRK